MISLQNKCTVSIGVADPLKRNAVCKVIFKQRFIKLKTLKGLDDSSEKKVKYDINLRLRKTR